MADRGLPFARLPAPSMRFFEYESRAIVAKAGIPVTKYGFAKTAAEARRIAEEIGGPVVIKSQVLSGGRMKAGGVQFADTPGGGRGPRRDVLELEIGGHMPRGVLVDSRAAVKHEYYAGVVWDGLRKRPVMLFSDMGGIDIEEVAEQHPDHVARGHFSTLRPFPDWQAKQLIASLGVTGSALNRLTPILARLARLFLQYDMTLAEINPLGELEDGSFVALDAHMDMENEAPAPPEGAAARARRRRRGDPPGARADPVRARRRAGRLSGPPRRRRQRDRVRRQPGSGDRRGRRLADAVRRGPCARRPPGQLLRDRRQPLGPQGVGLAKLVLQKPGVDKIAVMMSIVSNTRVDIVARGVIKACLELGYDPAEKIAIFRIPGAWEEEGFKILERYGVEYADRSVSLHEAARRAVEKIQGATASPGEHFQRTAKSAEPDA